MEYKDPVVIKLWTSAVSRLSKLGYTLPTRPREVDPNHTWREVLFSVFQITFDESEYRVKLCKRKSSQMYRLNEKVGDLIGKKRRNNPFQIVCLRIKRRKKITMFDKQLERGQPNLNQSQKMKSNGNSEHLQNTSPTFAQNEGNTDAQSGQISNHSGNDSNFNDCLQSGNAELADENRHLEISPTLEERNGDGSPCLENMEQDDERICNIRELQSIQELTSGQLVTARELSAKLEQEKFALIKDSNAKYLDYERALAESKKKLKSSEAKIVSLEEEKEAEKLATIKNITQLQDELNEVLVKVSELAEKEIRFAEMQEELLTWGKKYDEVKQVLAQSKEKAEAAIVQVSEWMAIAQNFSHEIKTPQDLMGLLLEKGTESDGLRSRNSSLERRLIFVDEEINGHRKESNILKMNETVLFTKIKELQHQIKTVSEERDDLQVKNEQKLKALESVLSATLTAIPNFK